jgi:hypothetical protein
MSASSWRWQWTEKWSEIDIIITLSILMNLAEESPRPMDGTSGSNDWISWSCRIAEHLRNVERKRALQLKASSLVSLKSAKAERSILIDGGFPWKGWKSSPMLCGLAY